MSDGLLVTGKMPPNVKTETLGAFLPQFFGRTNQDAKELNLGNMTSMTLMFGQVPCQIFKTGTVYFVVLGRAEEDLPAAQLKVIAEEVARQNH
jgi:predicted regulator of Ras-like GTPase activity (Roadblock/LC7/MglB family)